MKYAKINILNTVIQEQGELYLVLMDNELIAKASLNINRLGQKLSDLTLCIVALNQDYMPYQTGNGFIWKNKDKLMLVTANHVCLDGLGERIKDLYIETGIVKDEGTLCLEVGGLLYSNDSYDIAVYDCSLLANYTTYYAADWGTYDLEEFYAFYCSKAMGLSRENGAIRTLKRLPIFFYDITLAGGVNDHQLRFNLNIDTTNYTVDLRGCSGSPIVDPEGKIISILTSVSTDNKRIIYGTNIIEIRETINSL